MHYVPYEKMSKKEQKKINAMKRGTWGSLKPTTRKPKNSKAYDRNRMRHQSNDSDGAFSFMYILHTA